VRLLFPGGKPAKCNLRDFDFFFSRPGVMGPLGMVAAEERSEVVPNEATRGNITKQR